MPKFQVLRRVDAFVDYVAEVEAATAEEAARAAADAEERYVWHETGIAQFDARSFTTLDVNGEEIERSQVGDF